MKKQRQNAKVKTPAYVFNKLIARWQTLSLCTYR